jgi:hypothetical protein
MCIPTSNRTQKNKVKNTISSLKNCSVLKSYTELSLRTDGDPGMSTVKNMHTTKKTRTGFAFYKIYLIPLTEGYVNEDAGHPMRQNNESANWSTHWTNPSKKKCK